MILPWASQGDWPGITPEAKPVTESGLDGSRHTDGTVAVRAVRATGSCDNRNFYLVVTQWYVVCVLLSLTRPLTCSGACTGGNHSPKISEGWDVQGRPCSGTGAPSPVCQAEELRVVPQPLARACWGHLPLAPLPSLPHYPTEPVPRPTCRIKNLSAEFSNHCGAATGGFDSPL